MIRQHQDLNEEDIEAQIEKEIQRRLANMGMQPDGKSSLNTNTGFENKNFRGAHGSNISSHDNIAPSDSTGAFVK